MITEDKVTDFYCMADDFCKFFDAMVAKYTLKPTGKRKYHRDSTMSKAEVMLIMILFHDSGYRYFKHFCITIWNPLAIKCVKLVLDGVTYTYLFYGYNTPPPTIGSGGKL